MRLHSLSLILKTRDLGFEFRAIESPFCLLHCCFCVRNQTTGDCTVYVPGDVQISRTTVTTTCLYRTCVTTSFKLLLIGTGCAISFYQKNVRRCFYFSSTYLRDTRLLSPRVPFFVANGTVTPNKRNILNMQRTRDSIFVPPLQPNELLCGLLWDPRQVWWIDCYGPSRCRRTAVV